MRAANPTIFESDSIACACTNLKMAARATARLYDRALMPLGLNAMQFAILNNVGKHGSVAKMDLAALLSLDRTTLYRALSILDRKGVFDTKAGRGREEIISLTEAGEALRAEALVVWDGAQHEFITRFGPEWGVFLDQVRHARVVAENALRS